MCQVGSVALTGWLELIRYRVFMTEAPHVHFRRHRFPAEIIAHAVWLYYRFPLSFRDVEDLLAERGINVSFQTVSKWAVKFGLKFAHQLRRCSRGHFADKWQLDEMVVTLKGNKYWLWRAVDANGYVLDALLQSQSDLPLNCHPAALRASAGVNRRILSRAPTRTSIWFGRFCFTAGGSSIGKGG